MHIADPINVLIVDDEKKACTNLKNMLHEYACPGLNIVGTANNTHEAKVQIDKWKPAAVFLDIEMPNENAFDFLERISPFDFEIIFVTSYDEYAVKAFKLNAIDYILKPISISELKNAVARLHERISYKKNTRYVHTHYAQVFDDVKNKSVPSRIVLKDANGIEVIDFTGICYVEAQSSYSKIVFIKDNRTREMIMSNPLSDYEELLPGDLFYRIHRSYLVNCSLIKKISNDGSNNIVLKDNMVLPVSRRRFASLIEFLKKNPYLYE